MDTEMTSSLNSKYSLYMIKTTHLSDEPKKKPHARKREAFQQECLCLKKRLLSLLKLLRR